MKNVSKTIFAAAAALSFTCAFSQTPPSCNDKNTALGVVKIIRESIVPGDKYKAVSLETYLKYVTLELAIPTGYQKEIKRFQCKATLVVDSSNGVDSSGRALLTDAQKIYDSGYDIFQLERVHASDLDTKKPRFSFPISYSSQNVDGLHYVEVSGILKSRSLFIGTYVAAHAEPSSK